MWPGKVLLRVSTNLVSQLKIYRSGWGQSWCCFFVLACRDGTNLWRDSERPTDILEQLCKRRGLGLPNYQGARRCQVAGQQYFLTAEGKCLFACHVVGRQEW